MGAIATLYPFIHLLPACLPNRNVLLTVPPIHTTYTLFLSHPILVILVYSLQEMEKALSTIQAAEGKSIDDLEKQLETTQEIYDSMETNLNGDILQNLINIVLSVDNDGDMILDDDEIQELIFKFEGLNGVDLDDDKFRQVIIDNGRSLNAIMELVRNLLEDPDGTAGHDDIFQLRSGGS